MPLGEQRLVKSRSNGRLIGASGRFMSAYPEILAIVPTHSAGEQLAHQNPGTAGLHRLTLLQLASDLARPAMAELGLAPLTPLGLEAVAARIVYQARTEHQLEYFQPVAALPG